MKQFNVVDAWINNVAYSHSESKLTGPIYKHDLKLFCDFIELTPEEIIRDYDSLDEKTFKRKYARCLRAFINKLSEDDKAINTVASKVCSVRSFFKYNDLPLGYVPLARRRVTFHNRDITKEEIERVFEGCNPRDRAYFCMMAQSGLRPETLCKLKVKNIEPDFSEGVIPCKIDVPEDLAKGKYGSYFSFMAQESVDYLKTYFLRNRSNITKNSYLFTNHGTENKANVKSLSGIFMKHIRALRKKGVMDYELREGKPSELRLYNLRKYFKKNAGQMGSEESEFLMGHTQGVKDHYLARDPEHYRKLYAEKAMPFLRFNEATPTETDRVIQKQAKKIEDLETRIKLLESSKEIIQMYNSIVPKNVTEAEKQAHRTFYANWMKNLVSPQGKKLLLKTVEDTKKEIENAKKKDEE